jgi:VWFA-related protein
VRTVVRKGHDVRFSLSLLAGAVLIVSSLDQIPLGQVVPALQAQDAPPLFSVKSELVVLNVTVRDKGHRYLDGLNKDAFTVFDNDQSQPVRFFLHEDAPVTIGLLIDNSGSMQPNRELVLAAASAFAESSNPQDDMFGLAFNEVVHATLTAAAPFTHDPGVLRGGLDREITTRGRTALYDALSRGLDYVERGSHDRKVLVVVSDGADNASVTPCEELLKKIKSSNTIVYAVALVDPVEMSAPGARQLREFAEISGGELFRPGNVKQVKDVLQRIALEIRHTYVMAYEPTDASRAPGLRRVRVAVQAPDHQKVTVRMRTGFPAAASDGPRGDPANVR